jgi:hypothetical protein
MMMMMMMMMMMRLMTRLSYLAVESFGSWSKHSETGPKSIGIGLRRFVGTAPGILVRG